MYKDILLKIFLLYFSRSVFNPRISKEEIQDATVALHCGILEHFSPNAHCPVSCKHTHFNFVFKHKVQKSNDRGYILLEKEDFSRCHFPNQWDMIVDVLR